MRFTPKPITLVDLLVSLNNTPAADGELVVDRANGGDNDGDLHRAVDPVQLESPLRGQWRVMDTFCPLEAPFGLSGACPETMLKHMAVMVNEL